MQASLDKPFRERITAAGQGTHAQLGPGQAMVVRWASSHNNTFTFAVVAATDQEWFYHKDYYAFLDDYVSSARPSICRCKLHFYCPMPYDTDAEACVTWAVLH